jgi:hypothetical protein
VDNLVKTFELDNVKDIREANKEAISLAKEILKEEIELTPYVVAKFIKLSGYENLEVFIFVSDTEKDPFNDEDEYEENIYYILYETGDAIRVNYGEFERLLRTYIEIELERGIYIKEDEKDEFIELIENYSI